VVFVVAGIAVAFSGYHVTPPRDASGLFVPGSYNCSGPLKQGADQPRPKPGSGYGGVQDLQPPCQDVGRTRLATAGVLALAGILLLAFEVRLPTGRRNESN